MCALEVEGNLRTGLSYDSDLRCRYLYDIVMTGVDGPQKSIVLPSDGLITLRFGEENSFAARVGYDLAAVFAHPACSRIAFSGGIGWERTVRKDLLLALHGDFAYGAGNFSAWENRHVSGTIDGYIEWAAGEQVSLYGTVSAAYWKGLLADKLDYLDGPVIGGEGGIIWYPEGDAAHLKIGAGGAVTLFRDEVFMTDLPFAISGRYGEFLLTAETAYRYKKFTVQGEVRYRYLQWFNKDNLESGPKRRTDHILTTVPELRFDLTGYLGLSLSYALTAAFSNIGADAGDYTDYTYLRHVGTLSVYGWF